MSEASRILVVDDEDAGRFVKVQTLRRAGFNVVEASTGADALALAASDRPDLIVLDVNLPDINGIEVCRRLRLADSSPALQILQISNTAMTSADRVRGLQQGADTYLVEPVDAEVLVATVHSLLRVRRAEAALAAALEGERQARRIAEEASRLKDEFIATLSHELRTPLNALMGWIWQLRHTTLDQASRDRALESLDRNARMQAQLINDLLDVSRVSKGKLQLEMRVVDVQTVVRTAVESVRESAARKQLELRTKLAPVAVAGDQARLQQIVTNLLTNAVQFTPVGGQISAEVSAEGDEAVVTIRDTGSGIEAAFLPYVFDQFRQGEGGLSRKHGGLGLGLAVVRQLTELHGGSVSVASEGAGQGATFVVRLPRETILSHDGEGDPRLLLEGVSATVLSDDEGDQSTLQANLESSGAQVTGTAADGLDRPQGGADVVVRRAAPGGPLTFRLSSDAADAPWQSVPESAPPAELVRRIARLVTLSKAS